MGKTYQALERAEKESKEKQVEIILPIQDEASDKSKSYQHLKLKRLEPYEHLKTNLLNRFNDSQLKTILFNATMHGSGCSTTALHFAAILAKNPNLKILLIEVNLRTPSLRKRLKIKDAPDLVEIVTKQSHMTARIERIGSENLYVITCGGSNLLGPLGLFESGEFDRFLKTMRKRFDYIILDAPPVPIFSEFRILCNKADGVVLVIRAEKTRRQVAKKAKKEIEKAGGNLLGVVLNKRKYYIR